MNVLRFVPLILLLAAFDAQGYVLKVNSNGQIRRWNLLTYNPNVSTNVVNTNTHAIRYFLASDAYSTTNRTAELNAIRAAFAQWQAVPGTYLKFEEGGLVNPPVDVNVADNINLFYWAKASTFVNDGMDNISGSVGVTFSTFDANNNIVESDTVLNGVEYSWFTDYFTPNNPNQFVESLAIHEIGHLLGLNHSPVGGATLFHAGDSGVDVQVGLSADDIAAVRHLYSTNLSGYGAIRGTVTKAANPVLGAAVYVVDGAGNMVAGTVTDNNGNYLTVALVPGSYTVRTSPLEPVSVSPSLCAGPDIGPQYANADTSFLASTNFAVTVNAGTTNTMNFQVNAGTPAFYMGYIRRPTTSFGTYAMTTVPVAMTVGQSNYYIGGVSPTMPTNNATFTVTGDGLTVGATTFRNNLFTNGLGVFHAISAPISIASDATPGLRSFIVQQGTNIAIAHGFLDLRPVSVDYNFDGLDDAFQRTYFSPFTSPQAAPGLDVDGDGFNNAAEFIAGTNPTNAQSFLKMISPTNAPGGVAIRWESVSGKRYQVSGRTNVTTAPWLDAGLPVTASGSTAQYIDGATNFMRVYRVRVLP